MSYTPGPWEVFDGPEPGVDTASGDFSIVIYGEENEEAGVKGRTQREAKANAILIAAAPEMFETLAEICALANSYANDADLHRACMRAHHLLLERLQEELWNLS